MMFKRHQETFSVTFLQSSDIKNSVPAIAEELTDSTEISQRNEEKNKGAYVMSSASADINRLLAKSQSLVEQAQKGGRHDEKR